METKTCNKCNITKPLDEFYWKNKSRGYRDSRCKKCRYEIQKERYNEPEMSGERVCVWCNISQPIENFTPSKRNTGGRERACKNCRWIKRDKEAHKTSGRRHTLMRNYGITLEDYRTLEIQQDYKCALCNKTPKQKLAVDHCHETGRIRGLLCHSCNTSLGKLGDSVESIERVLRYLKGTT